MTLQAMGWAWNAELPCAEKMVLIRLGDMADMSGVAWPFQGRLAYDCGLTRPAARAVLDRLEKDGWLSIVSRHHDNSADRSCSYQLNIPAEVFIQVPAPTDDSPSGAVYVATTADRVKIGVSKDPVQRVRGIGNGIGQELLLVRTFPMAMSVARRAETEIFAVLAEFRLKGEWFSCGAEVAIRAVEGVIQ